MIHRKYLLALGGFVLGGGGLIFFLNGKPNALEKKTAEHKTSSREVLKVEPDLAQTKTLRDLEASVVEREPQEEQLAQVRALVKQGNSEAFRSLMKIVRSLPQDEFSSQVRDEIVKMSYPQIASDAIALLSSETHPGATTVEQSILASHLSPQVMENLLAKYNSLENEEFRKNLVGGIAVTTPEDVGAMKYIVNQDDIPASHGVMEASVIALKTAGTVPATDILIARLNRETTVEGRDRVVTEVSDIRNPRAESSFINAARGHSKLATESHTRLASIYALRQFPSEQAQNLLRELEANDPDPQVQEAAEATLNEIERVFKEGIDS